MSIRRVRSDCDVSHKQDKKFWGELGLNTGRVLGSEDKKEQVITLPKWDFGGDRSHTNKIWNDILSRLRALSEDSYPIVIMRIRV